MRMQTGGKGGRRESPTIYKVERKVRRREKIQLEKVKNLSVKHDFLSVFVSS